MIFLWKFLLVFFFILTQFCFLCELPLLICLTPCVSFEKSVTTHECSRKAFLWFRDPAFLDYYYYFFFWSYSRGLLCLFFPVGIYADQRRSSFGLINKWPLVLLHIVYSFPGLNKIKKKLLNPHLSFPRLIYFICHPFFNRRRWLSSPSSHRSRWSVARSHVVVSVCRQSVSAPHVTGVVCVVCIVISTHFTDETSPSLRMLMSLPRAQDELSKSRLSDDNKKKKDFEIFFCKKIFHFVDLSFFWDLNQNVTDLHNKTKKKKKKKKWNLPKVYKL